MKRCSISLIISDKANQNYDEIPTSYPLGWLLSKNQKTASDGEDVEKLEPLCTVGGNVKNIGLAKKIIWVFCTILWKNQNELFDQPNSTATGENIWRSSKNFKKNTL